MRSKQRKITNRPNGSAFLPLDTKNYLLIGVKSKKRVSVELSPTAMAPRSGVGATTLLLCLRMRQQLPPPSKPCFRSAPKYSRDTIGELRKSKMIEYEGQIRLKVQGTTQWVWVDVRAQSVMFARALLQAQYGRENVLTVQQKRKR